MTDALGTVYYANYFKYYERGRTGLFSDHGYAVEELNARGVNVLVFQVDATFRRAGRLGDRLRVTTDMQSSESPDRIKLRQVIFRGDELTNQADVQLVCVNENGALREFPEELLGLVQDASGRRLRKSVIHITSGSRPFASMDHGSDQVFTVFE